MKTRAVVLAVILGAVPLLLTARSAGAVAGCAPIAGGFVCYEAGEGHGAELLAATGDVAAAIVAFRDGLTGIALYPRDLTVRAFLECSALTQTYVVEVEVSGVIDSFDTTVAC